MFLFDLDSINKNIEELNKETLKDGFWNEVENSSKVLAELKRLEKKKTSFIKVKEELENLIEVNDMLILENDEDLCREIVDNTKKIEKIIETMELELMFTGKYDKNNAIITLHPGAGGTESQDWAEMLYRMYTKWAISNGFTVKELDYLEGDEAGIKSVAFLEVLPEITEDVEIQINPEDLRIDTYRASGAGGQHINKTDSAIRITHIPTNIVVSCQSERSQIQNRETAMKMLKSKLLDLKEKEQKEKIEDLKGIQKEIAWGSQIRSYVFHPYSMVKDHRTGHETGNVEAVMNGDLNEFMRAYLLKTK